MHSKVLAVVVAYNGIKWIEKCIGSVLSSTLPVDVLVVDNGSTDGTSQYIESNFPSVRLIKSATNLYFGRANNIGLKIALEEEYDYAFLLNQDAWVEERCLEFLLNSSIKFPNYGILSPVHLDPKTQKLEYHFSTYVSPAYCNNFISDAFFKDLDEVYTTKFVNAACWLLPLNCIKAVGGFNTLFLHYGEDEDYVNRAHFFGLEVGVVPKAIAWHDITIKTWDQIYWNRNRQKIFAYITLANINTSYKSALLVYFKNTFDCIITFLLTRKFKKAFYLSSIMFSLIKELGIVKKARNISRKNQAYIYD
ncbi:glycosyltransferase family 2 protein [Pontibacter sp. Tf4]|uniref:glycosyltransferase family 2 protein n=1 Tax=Pontibacter sp. Tf4 TaxID=2761620 RepID=UPI0016269410|nr:glycosyltransferase family 2 protein [Pontibacter sp. Tf4]MBB6610337.1 glycosyltransferase family 2 protein [Pontibacter sp. Tf4]